VSMLPCTCGFQGATRVEEAVDDEDVGTDRVHAGWVGRPAVARESPRVSGVSRLRVLEEAVRSSSACRWISSCIFTIGP
jgi:hypothetical protein